MTHSTPPRPRKLTADELKAAEAAYQGRPFNERWSEAARVVYNGMLAATRKLQAPVVEPAAGPALRLSVDAESEMDALLETAEKGEE